MTAQSNLKLYFIRTEKHRFVVTLTINNCNTNVLKNVKNTYKPSVYKKMNCFSIVNVDLLT